MKARTDHWDVAEGLLAFSILVGLFSACCWRLGVDAAFAVLAPYLAVMAWVLGESSSKRSKN